MGAGKGDRVVFVLVEFNQIHERIKLFALGSTVSRMKYLGNSGKSSLVFLLRTYGTDGCHFYTP